MASMLAACYFKDAEILVSSDEYTAFSPDKQHLAVLRFKTPLISQITGIPMPKETVYKGIWDSDSKSFVAPNIKAANAYSLKVAGVIANRSILSADMRPVERYVPSNDFVEQLYNLVESRIHVVPAYPKYFQSAVINTCPLWLFSDEIEIQKTERNLKAISVYQFRVPANVHQTIYFPYDPLLYRATIEYDILKIELLAKDGFKGFPTSLVERILNTVVCPAFGLDALKRNGIKMKDCIGGNTYALGKLPQVFLEEAKRKAIIYQLTKERNIYSLGRYATLRNIGLDDIAKDLFSIDKMLNIDSYTSKLRIINGGMEV